MLLYLLAPIVLIVGSVMLANSYHTIGIFGSDLSFVGWVLILIGCAVLLYGYDHEVMTPKHTPTEIADSSDSCNSEDAGDMQWIGEVEDTED